MVPHRDVLGLIIIGMGCFSVKKNLSQLQASMSQANDAPQTVSHDTEASISVRTTTHRERLAALGDLLFFHKNESRDLFRDNEIFVDKASLTTRELCDRMDGFKESKQRKDQISMFVDCMEAMEKQQRRIRSELPERCDSKSDDVVQIHSYWDGPFAETAKLGLVSSVYAHGPGCAHLTIYSESIEAKHSIEEGLLPYLGSQHFHVEILNSTKLVGLIVEHNPDLKPAIEKVGNFTLSLDRRPPNFSRTLYSDLVRVLVLAAYGGVYLDSDVLVLNSLAPLLASGKDFFYRWSIHRFSNTAVLSMSTGSPASKALVKMILESHDTEDASGKMHPWNISLYKRPKEVNQIENLPASYFDPSWVSFDLKLNKINQWTAAHYHLNRFGKPFFKAQEQAWNTTEFFPGIFGYHWHNGFTNGIGNNSVADTFWRYFETKKEHYNALL